MFYLGHGRIFITKSLLENLTPPILLLTLNTPTSLNWIRLNSPLAEGENTGRVRVKNPIFIIMGYFIMQYHLWNKSKVSKILL